MWPDPVLSVKRTLTDNQPFRQMYEIYLNV